MTWTILTDESTQDDESALEAEIDRFMRSLFDLADDVALSKMDQAIQAGVPLIEMSEWCSGLMPNGRANGPARDERVYRLWGFVDDLGPPKHDWRCNQTGCGGCE